MITIFKIIRHLGKVAICSTLSGINTAYYLVVPSKRKIIVNGFLSKFLFHVKKKNFGDDLNFYLLSKLSGKIVFSAQDLLTNDENIVFIGSILQKYVNTNSIVWGAGVIQEDSILPAVPKKICSVRGPLTRNWFLDKGYECPAVYGDPALLMPLLYTPKNKKRYKFGIIPHYIDWNNQNVKSLESILGANECVLIDMVHYRTIEDLIERINECEYILSSSLHGLIISDAYKIPNLWVEFSNNVAGDGFKFRDYFMSVNRFVESPLQITKTTTVEDITKDLFQYKAPAINVMPLLQKSPLNIPQDIIDKAKQYY